MSQLHIAQAGFIKPVLDGLELAGVNVNRLLVAAGLNRFQLNSAGAYVPVHSMYSLFDELKNQEGIIDVLDQFSEQIELVSLSQWGEMIAYTPDILSAIQMSVKYDAVVLSHEKAGLELKGNRAKYWQRFTDKPSKGREQADFLSFALAIKGFQIAAGVNWAPLEIHLQSHIAPNLDAVLPSGNNTKIRLGQAATAIVFPTSLLAWPMLGQKTTDNQLTEFARTATLSNRIENILNTVQADCILNMSLISEITGAPSRTLQRQLAREKSSISSIIEQWRFKQSIQLLRNTDAKITDISAQLGYANSPNFVRAFRRWTGVSSNRYRDQ